MRKVKTPQRTKRKQQDRCPITWKTKGNLRRQPADGGAEGDRTPDLVIANDALSQLSYGPLQRMGGIYEPCRVAVKRQLARLPCRRRQRDCPCRPWRQWLHVSGS